MATSVTLVATPATPAGAETPTNTTRAQRGAQWIANQIRANGGYLRNFGKPDPVSTAYGVLSMRAAGIDLAASHMAVGFLKQRIGPQLQSAGADSAGALADYIMAAVADNQDSRHFGGKTPHNNLVNRLLATARTSGPNKGLFGVQDPTFDGAFRQGLALAALAAVHVKASNPRVAAGIAWLTKQQCANGLWQAYRPKPGTKCPAANPTTFTGPDTNSTALAVQGLAAWGKRPKQATVLTSLRTIQSADGGFPFVAAKNQASDPDSTGLVIQTLIAERSSPMLARWKKGAATPYSALGAYQLDCTNPDFGAFWFPGSQTTANTFATVQAVPAMSGKSFPLALSTKSTTVPLTPC